MRHFKISIGLFQFCLTHSHQRRHVDWHADLCMRQHSANMEVMAGPAYEPVGAKAQEDEPVQNLHCAWIW